MTQVTYWRKPVNLVGLFHGVESLEGIIMKTLQHVGHKVTWRLRQDNVIHHLTYKDRDTALAMVQTLQSKDVMTDKLNEYGQPIWKRVYTGDADYFNIAPVWKLQ